MIKHDLSVLYHNAFSNKVNLSAFDFIVNTLFYYMAQKLGITDKISNEVKTLFAISLTHEFNGKVNLFISLEELELHVLSLYGINKKFTDSDHRITSLWLGFIHYLDKVFTRLYNLSFKHKGLYSSDFFQNTKTMTEPYTITEELVLNSLSWIEECECNIENDLIGCHLQVNEIFQPLPADFNPEDHLRELAERVHQGLWNNVIIRDGVINTGDFIHHNMFMSCYPIEVQHTVLRYLRFNFKPDLYRKVNAISPLQDIVIPYREFEKLFINIKSFDNKCLNYYLILKNLIANEKINKFSELLTLKANILFWIRTRPLDSITKRIRTLFEDLLLDVTLFRLFSKPNETDEYICLLKYLKCELFENLNYRLYLEDNDVI